MNVSIGDSIIYNGDNRRLKAKVLDIKMSPYFPGMTCVIEFEDTGLYPRVMDVPMEYVSLCQSPVLYGDNKCTCGLKFTREGGRHSSWCEVKNY